MVSGIDGADHDQRGGEETLDIAHRPDEASPLGGRERFEQRLGQVIAAPVEHGSFGGALLGQPDRAHAPVPLARDDRHEIGRLERAQQSAEVARVDVEH